MKFRFLVVTACAALLTAVLPVMAHHSFAAEYDSTKTITVKGTIQKLDSELKTVNGKVEVLKDLDPTNVRTKLIATFDLTSILFVVVILGLVARVAGFNIFKFLIYIKEEILLVLAVSVVSFPLLLDRNVGIGVAVSTSMRAVAANPGVMALWGLIVAGALVLGSLPLFVGLVVVLPVLGHATWHLYRKVVPRIAAE